MMDSPDPQRQNQLKDGRGKGREQPIRNASTNADQGEDERDAESDDDDISGDDISEDSEDSSSFEWLQFLTHMLPQYLIAEEVHSRYQS